MMKKNKKVVVIYRFLPHYRKTFYERLRTLLKKNDIDLDLFYGDGDGIERKKQDKVEIEWAIKKPNYIIPLPKKYLIYQPFLLRALKYDLIVVEQANKLLLNYFLLVLKFFLPNLKLAYWGHGIDFQAKKRNSLNNILKKLFINMPDHWFAYNLKTVKILKEKEYPTNRITNVENTIDSEELISDLKDIKQREINEFNNKHGIGAGFKLLFIGGMYKNKRLDYIVNVSAILNEMGLKFTTIFAGSGPDQEFVINETNKYEYLNYIGPVYDKEKAILLKQTDCILMPGLVGLVVIDSFVSLSPIITTDFPHHSPEVDYINNNMNGFILDRNTTEKEYANFVFEYLNDDELIKKIKSNCYESGEYYTMQRMVNNFSNGIKTVLGN